MDPNTTWTRILDFIQNKNQDEIQNAKDHAALLLGWLSSGGFAPDITMNRDVDRYICASVCYTILTYRNPWVVLDYLINLRAF